MNFLVETMTFSH